MATRKNKKDDLANLEHYDFFNSETHILIGVFYGRRGDSQLIIPFTATVNYKYIHNLKSFAGRVLLSNEKLLLSYEITTNDRYSPSLQ